MGNQCTGFCLRKKTFNRLVDEDSMGAGVVKPQPDGRGGIRIHINPGNNHTPPSFGNRQYDTSSNQGNRSQSKPESTSCEECGQNFTPFRKKKQCKDCSRNFCSNCCVSAGSSSPRLVQCKKCQILLTGTFSRSLLAGWKVKDLKALLNKQNVNTSKCKEKEDLIELIFIYFGGNPNYNRQTSEQERFVEELALVSGRVKVQYNLGGNDGTSELSLDNAPASNGQWHTLLMRRIGKWFQLKMDGGEGRYYNESWGPESGHQLISIKMYQIVAGGHVVFSNNPIVNGQDLNKTCITDIRLNNKWFPMINSENGLSDAATLELEQGVENDCVRDDCYNVTCPIGNPISMVCYPLWGLHECRCPAGTYPDGYNCLEIDFCLQDNPCFDGSTCVPKPFPDNFTCVCPAGWTGRLCNILQSSVPATAGITTGFIVIIIVCIFLLLVVALVVFLAVRYNTSYDPERYILDVDPDDDIRENVINYNEEGAGEEDQEGYDIHRLRKPDEGDTLLKSPYNSLYTERFQGREPGERPDIGDFIGGRLADADNDPNAPPHDSVREFVNEGGGSDAGSLSSLQTGSSDNDQDYDYLNDWGPKFSKLANMYGGEEEDL